MRVIRIYIFRLTAWTDRFVLDNQELVNGIKAEQTTLKGRIDTARDAIDKLTKHKGEEIEKMIDRWVGSLCVPVIDLFLWSGKLTAWQLITRTIKHYEGEYGPGGSDEEARTIRTTTITQVSAKLPEQKHAQKAHGGETQLQTVKAKLVTQRDGQ
jgi:hypothetical protein